MSLNYRIVELVQDQGDPARFPNPGGRPGTGPAGLNPQPLYGWNPYTGLSQKNMTWSVAGYGWTDAAWYGRPELLMMPLTGSLILKRGWGTFSYTRPSTVNYTDELGATQTAAVDAPAFDWLAGPGGTNRWCLRCDQNDALLTTGQDRNLSRTKGALTLWVRTQRNESTSLPGDRIFFQTGSFRLYIPAGLTTLRWETVAEDGTVYQSDFSISGWTTSGAWHFVSVDWDRVAGNIHLWTEGVLRTTTATTKKFKELGSTLGIGQGVAAGVSCFYWIADFRTWPSVLTATLQSLLYQLKA